MDERIAIVGGCNIDISATSSTALIFQDSNPGKLETSLGGVGRNIGENLARLGYCVSLLAPIGNDAFRYKIEEQSRAVGIDLSHSLFVEDATTSSYLCINHPNGDIALAVSDMEICNRLTPAWLEKQLPFLNACPYVVIDANISEESLTYLATHCKSRLCADTVSTKKAERLLGALPSLFFLKANLAEAEILAGYPLEDHYSIRKAASGFHMAGVKNVAITLGTKGAFVSHHTDKAILSPMLATTVNSTGCGDAFFSGALHGLIQGKSLMDVLRYGLAMASICAGANSAVSPAVSQDLLDRTLKAYEGGLH